MYPRFQVSKGWVWNSSLADIRFSQYITVENGAVSRCKPYFSLSARDEDSSITVIELSFYKGKKMTVPVATPPRCSVYSATPYRRHAIKRLTPIVSILDHHQSS